MKNKPTNNPASAPIVPRIWLITTTTGKKIAIQANDEQEIPAKLGRGFKEKIIEAIPTSKTKLKLCA
jgi:hypothetical protein